MGKIKVCSHFRYVRISWMLLFILLSSVMSSCAPMDNNGASPDYKETKQIVLDILQTEEGQKAIQEVVTNKEMKHQLLLDEQSVKQAIQETLLDGENKDKWQQLMNDPEFAKKYAKQLEEENKRLIKSLMKDPEYRASMIEIFHDPEMEKQFLEVAKTNEFRQQTMTVMKEAMESPYFRLELLELLSKVAQEPPKQEEGKKEGKKEGKGGSEDGG